MIPRTDLLQDTSLKKACALLSYLGVTPNYVGFLHTAYAVKLAVEDPQYLLCVTKWLYPNVAEHCDTTWQAVERNIRTVISAVWRENPDRLSVLSGTLLRKKPRTAQFLAILSTCCARDPAPFL